MDDSPAETEEPSPTTIPQWTLKWGEAALQGTALVMALACLAWLLVPLVRHGAIPGDWQPHALLCVAAILAVAAGTVRSYRQWRVPARHLCQILPQVHRAEMPIGALRDFEGAGLESLIPLLEAILFDLRRQRGEVKKLEFEIRQRVANRTDALERAIGSLKHKASRDALTGLYNRRTLDEQLPELVERRKTQSPGLCLLMIDVDHFKLLNDTLGHAAGDELLRSIGQLIRSSIRETDMAFRCGGDEFVVVLDDCNHNDGRFMADRLTSLVDGLTRTMRLPLPPRLSIGVSRLSDLDERSPEALLKEADRILYEVKGARKAALKSKDILVRR